MPFIALFDNWWVLYMFNLIPSASEYTNIGILAKTICQSGTFHIVRELALNQYLLFKHLQNHTQVSVFTDLNITSLYYLPSAGWHQAVLSVALFKKGFVFWNHYWKYSCWSTIEPCLIYSLACFCAEIRELAGVCVCLSLSVI